MADDPVHVRCRRGYVGEAELPLAAINPDTDEGRLVGHIVMESVLLSRSIDAIPDFPDDLLCLTELMFLYKKQAG